MKALRVIMGSVALLLTVAALLCAFAHFYFFDPERYEADIFCDGFFEAALRERDRGLDELESVVAVEREALLGFFDDESCKDVSRRYVRGLLSEVLEGKKDAMDIKYAPEGLREFLDKEFEKYDFSDTAYGDSATASEKAYDMTVNRMSNAVCFTPQTYVQKALGYISGIRSAVASVCSFWYVFAILAVGLLCGTLFLCRDGRRIGLFMPSAFLWCGCMLVFIPAALVFFGDVADTLELSKNQLYYVLTGGLDAMKAGAFITTVAPAVLSTALLVYSVFLYEKEQ